MMKMSLLVANKKAEKILRFLNFIIDYLFCLVIVMMIWMLFVGVYAIIMGEDVDVLLSQLENINTLIDRIISALLYGLVMFAIEGFTKGRSLGKLITGTRVVMDDGSEPKWGDYMKRNLSRVIPFDALSFLGSNGWHDSWSDTQVVKWKKYKETLQREQELEQLGKVI